MSKFVIEVEVVKFDAGPQYVAELKRDGNKWLLRIDADKCETRRELNELVHRQINFAGIQLAAAVTSEHVWPA